MLGMADDPGWGRSCKIGWRVAHIRKACHRRRHDRDENDIAVPVTVDNSSLDAVGFPVAGFSMACTTLTQRFQITCVGDGMKFNSLMLPCLGSIVIVTMFIWPACAERQEQPEPWVTDEDRAIARALTDALTLDQRDRWLVSLVKVLGWSPYVKPMKPRSVDQTPTPLAPLRALINRAKSRGESHNDWAAMLELFERPGEIKSSQWSISRIPLYAWADELTARACEKVVDKTKLDEDDHLAIFRLLARARFGDDRHQSVSRFAVQRDPNKYRAKYFVNFANIEVVDHESIDAPENAFSVDTMHYLWLRGRGKNRSLALAITDHLPPNYKRSDRNRFEGRFLKLTPHDSDGQMQSVPVFVGRIIVSEFVTNKRYSN